MPIRKLYRNSYVTGIIEARRSGRFACATREIKTTGKSHVWIARTARREMSSSNHECRLVPYVLQNWPERSAPSSGLSPEESFSLDLGMSTPDNRSGKYPGTNTPKHVNARAKAAMMMASKVRAGAARAPRKGKRGKNTTRQFAPWADTDLGSYTRCSGKNVTTRYVLKERIPKARSI